MGLIHWKKKKLTIFTLARNCCWLHMTCQKIHKMKYALLIIIDWNVSLFKALRGEWEEIAGGGKRGLPGRREVGNFSLFLHFLAFFLLTFVCARLHIMWTPGTGDETMEMIVSGRRDVDPRLTGLPELPWAIQLFSTFLITKLGEPFTWQRKRWLSYRASKIRLARSSWLGQRSQRFYHINAGLTWPGWEGDPLSPANFSGQRPPDIFIG